MVGPSTLLIGATALFYTLAAILHLLSLLWRGTERWAGWLTRSGWIAQTGALLLLVMEGHAALTSLVDFTLLFCWVLMGAYVLLSLWLRSEAAGPFVLPVIALAVVLAMAVGDRPGEGGALSPSFLLWHVGVALLAYACLFLAALAGVFYLVQETNLRRKRWGRLYYRLPSLEALDRWALRFAWLGHPLLTLTAATGLVQAGSRWTYEDPKILFTVGLWLLWGGYLLLRHQRGWGGRRAAWLGVVGFCGILANWLLVNMLSGAHRFGV